MGSSGGVETKQKQNGKTPQYTSRVSHPLLPRTTEALRQVRAQANPLGLTVARTSRDQ